jgi:hypothetical protein
MKVGLMLCLLAAAVFAQETAKGPEMTDAERRFQESMVNVTLAGYFTSGDKAELKEDKYTIERVTKVKDDLWKFEARIQYNKKDVPVAMSLPVKWAGDTPVISLTNFAVPGFGSFTARVLIYKDSYAGTWGDENHGGKLFGKIVRNAAPAR